MPIAASPSVVQSAFTAAPVVFTMKMRALPLAAALVAILAATSVGAPIGAQQANKPIYLAASVSMEQAVKTAEQRYKARVVRAETQHDDAGHTIYVLRLLNESGHVWTVRIDASNGAVL